MYPIFLKVATLNISNNYCGRFVIKLKGTNPDYFTVIGRDLYLIKEPIAGSYSVIVSIEDPAGRFTAKTQTYSLTVTDCPTTVPP